MFLNQRSPSDGFHPGRYCLPDIPKRLLVIGGGYIGLEIGMVYAALGSKVTVVEFLEGILMQADRNLVKPLEDRLQEGIRKHFLKHQGRIAFGNQARRITAALEGKNAPPQDTFDRVLVSVGRKPNTAGLGLEKTKVKLDDRGYIQVDKQRRASNPKILAIGDAAGEPGLAHKATAEARVAVETILGEPSEWAPRDPRSHLYRSGDRLVWVNKSRPRSRTFPCKW